MELNDELELIDNPGELRVAQAKTVGIKRKLHLADGPQNVDSPPGSPVPRALSPAEGAFEVPPFEDVNDGAFGDVGGIRLDRKKHKRRKMLQNFDKLKKFEKAALLLQHEAEQNKLSPFEALPIELKSHILSFAYGTPEIGAVSKEVIEAIPEAAKTTEERMSEFGFTRIVRDDFSRRSDKGEFLKETFTRVSHQIRRLVTSPDEDGVEVDQWIYGPNLFQSTVIDMNAYTAPFDRETLYYRERENYHDERVISSNKFAIWNELRTKLTGCLKLKTFREEQVGETGKLAKYSFAKGYVTENGLPVVPQKTFSPIKKYRRWQFDYHGDKPSE